MSKLILLALLTSALFVFGCQTSPMADRATEDNREVVTCQTCTMQFGTREEAVRHMVEHPDHEFQASDSPILKCSTCGMEFTSAAELKQDLHEGQDHKAAFKCSTCGAEFTSMEKWN